MSKSSLKVLLLGNSGTGKTAFATRAAKNTFNSKHKSTVGVDFFPLNLSIHGTEVTVNVWDTAGQERFSSLVESYYRGADACVLCYDPTHPASFIALTKWHASVLGHLDLPPPAAGVASSSAAPLPVPFPFIVVATKSDLLEPGHGYPASDLVDYAQVAEWCGRLGVPHFVASAATGAGVSQVMRAVAELAWQYQNQPQSSSLALGRNSTGSQSTLIGVMRVSNGGGKSQPPLHGGSSSCQCG
ncbi:P-loop containing nucleoside triphosphate hydrolase protein [Blastocladiella britannica]|nr:P-loop containing nucleoside triphosphate hydrolase protein [Blastocladiella britannica]